MFFGLQHQWVAVNISRCAKRVIAMKNRDGALHCVNFVMR